MSAANEGRRRKWAREIDPDGVLPSEELEKRVKSAESQHMRRMTLASATKRRARREAEEEADGRTGKT